MLPRGLAWSARAEVPLDSGWSKNRMWLPRAGTHARRLSPDARARRDGLADALRAELGDDVRPNGLVRPVVQDRLLVAVAAHKRDHRGDAVNVLDMVLDAVERATGLDDRWFEVAGLCWDVRPTDPSLVVAIGQQRRRDRAVCSVCGLVLPVGKFPKGTVHQGVCLGCAPGKRRAATDRRRALREADRPPAEPGGDAPPWR